MNTYRNRPLCLLLEKPLQFDGCTGSYHSPSFVESISKVNSSPIISNVYFISVSFAMATNKEPTSAIAQKVLERYEAGIPLFTREVLEDLNRQLEEGRKIVTIKDYYGCE